MELMQLIPNTPEWLKARKEHVGASDAPIVMQVSPFKTPYRLWQEKLSLAEPTDQNWAQQRGHELEPIALGALQEKLGMPLRPHCVLHNQRSWMMASLDALSDDRRTLAEIKCPGAEDHGTALAGKVPEKYFPQLQHQLEVCQLDSMYYFSYTETSTAIISVHRDDKYIKKLIEEEEKFWECVKNFESPALTTRDYVYKGDAHWAKLAERLKQLDVLEAEREAIRKELIALANGQNTMGAGIKVTKCSRKGAVNYSAIPELRDVDLDTYRKPATEYWKIS